MAKNCNPSSGLLPTPRSDCNKVEREVILYHSEFIEEQYKNTAFDLELLDPWLLPYNLLTSIGMDIPEGTSFTARLQLIAANNKIVNHNDIKYTLNQLIFLEGGPRAPGTRRIGNFVQHAVWIRQEESLINWDVELNNIYEVTFKCASTINLPFTPTGKAKHLNILVVSHMKLWLSVHQPFGQPRPYNSPVPYHVSLDAKYPDRLYTHLPIHINKGTFDGIKISGDHTETKNKFLVKVNAPLMTIEQFNHHIKFTKWSSYKRRCLFKSREETSKENARREASGVLHGLRVACAIEQNPEVAKFVDEIRDDDHYEYLRRYGPATYPRPSSSHVAHGLKKYADM